MFCAKAFSGGKIYIATDQFHVGKRSGVTFVNGSMTGSRNPATSDHGNPECHFIP
jgi:hypothetical protein